MVTGSLVHPVPKARIQGDGDVFNADMCVCKWFLSCFDDFEILRYGNARRSSTKNNASVSHLATLLETLNLVSSLRSVDDPIPHFTGSVARTAPPLAIGHNILKEQGQARGRDREGRCGCSLLEVRSAISEILEVLRIHILDQSCKVVSHDVPRPDSETFVVRTHTQFTFNPCRQLASKFVKMTGLFEANDVCEVDVRTSKCT